MSKYNVGISILACLFVLGCAAKGPISNLPISSEAKIVESTTPAEVMVEASGIGRDVDEALLDARRSAVNVVLIGGSDPLLETPEERAKFKLIQEEFYAEPSVNQYITFESPWSDHEHSKQIKIEGGKKTKVTKHFKVNKKMLQDEMVRRGIMMPKKEIEDAMGRPNIDVIPQVPKGEDPIATMNSAPALRHAAQAIGSYLSARDYEYEDIEQKINMDEFVGAQQALAGISEDPSHILALALGGDAYIAFTAKVQPSVSEKGVPGMKAVVGITSYETTTARSLGTETGYSETRPGTTELSLIEEAVKKSGVIDNVLSRIDAYWKKDIEQGIQYRVVIKIVGDFDKDERETISSVMTRILKKQCKFTKPNIITDQTLDYQVWVSPKEIHDNIELRDLLKQDFPTEFQGGVLRSVHMFKKLILLQVNNAEQ